MGWKATVIASGYDAEGVEHISFEIHVADAASADKAKEVAEFLTQRLKGDSLALVRAEPSGDSYHDFETDIVSHAGYSRFTIAAVEKVP